MGERDADGAFEFFTRNFTCTFFFFFLEFSSRSTYGHGDSKSAFLCSSVKTTGAKAGPRSARTGRETDRTIQIAAAAASAIDSRARRFCNSSGDSPGDR